MMRVQSGNFGQVIRGALNASIEIYSAKWQTRERHARMAVPVLDLNSRSNCGIQDNEFTFAPSHRPSLNPDRAPAVSAVLSPLEGEVRLAWVERPPAVFQIDAGGTCPQSPWMAAQILRPGSVEPADFASGSLVALTAVAGAAVGTAAVYAAAFVAVAAVVESVVAAIVAVAVPRAAAVPEAAAEAAVAAFVAVVVPQAAAGVAAAALAVVAGLRAVAGSAVVAAVNAAVVALAVAGASVGSAFVSVVAAVVLARRPTGMI